MKKRIVIAAMLALATTAKAQQYGYLMIGMQDGTEHAIATSGLTLTFADGQLTATSQGETLTMQQSLLSRMYFSEQQSSGIDSAETPQPVTIRVADRMVQVSAEQGAQVVIADIGGRLVDRYTAGYESVATPLRPGIYIIKVNDKSTKIHVR